MSDTVRGAPLVAQVGPSITLYTILREQMHALKGEGYQVVCVCDDDNWAAKLRELGFSVVPIGMGRRPSPLAVIKWMMLLWIFLRRAHVDVLHTTNAFHGFAARIVGRCAGSVVVVHTVHNWYFLQPGGRHRWCLSQLERLGGHLAHAVMFVGRDDLEFARRHKLVPDDRCVFIGDGVDIRGLAAVERSVSRGEARRRLDVSSGQYLVVMVARAEPPKDQRLFLSAFEQFAASNPQAIAFMIGGGSGLEELRGAVDRSQVGDRIRVFDQSDDVPIFLRAADVLVLASAYEAFGRAIAEGMVLGVPVVATDVPGLRHVIRHRRTGLLTEYGNPIALAQALEESFRDRPGASARARLAQTHAAAAFDSRDVSRRVSATYRRLLGEAV